MGALFWLWTIAGLICGLLPYLPFNLVSGVFIGMIAGLLHEQSAQTRKTIDRLMAQIIRLDNTIDTQTEELQRLGKLFKRGNTAKHATTTPEAANTDRTTDLAEVPDAVRHLWRESSTMETRRNAGEKDPVTAQAASRTAATPVTPATMTALPSTPAETPALSGAPGTDGTIATSAAIAPEIPETPPTQQAACTTPLTARITQKPEPEQIPTPAPVTATTTPADPIPEPLSSISMIVPS